MDYTEALRRINEAEDTGATVLDLSDLDSRRLPHELTLLTALQSLNLSGCKQLSDISPLAGLTALQSLNLSGCKQLSGDLSPLAGLTALQSLNLSECWHLGGDLSPLAALTSLQSFNIHWCDQLRDLSPLAGLTALQWINLSGCNQLSDISPLARLTSLQSLDISHCDQLRDLSPLVGLTSLQSLDISYCHQLRDLSPLVGLTALQWLNLTGYYQFSDFSPLASLTSLQSLNLAECMQLSDLSALDDLTKLQSLNLRSCMELSDLSPLSALTSLQALSLSWCQQLSDLSPLSSLVSLELLDLSGCLSVRRFAPLESLLPTLKQLYLFDCELDDLPAEVCGEERNENVLDKVRAHYANLKAVQRIDADIETHLKDFFITHHPADTAWAEWIASTLEQAGYSFIVQARNFRAADQGFLEVQQLASETAHTIVLLSENYLQSDFAASEWAAFTQDLEGKEPKLIPIRLDTCKPKGMLASIRFVDLVGLLPEDASAALLEVLSKIAKPISVPAFTGAQPVGRFRTPPDYPGTSQLEHSLSKDPHLVPILYATNRDSTNDEDVKFSYEWSPNLSYGFAIVQVPERHAVGHIERPKRWSFLGIDIRTEQESESAHFILKGLGRLTQEQFTEIIQKNTKSSVLVFVHGYKTAFIEAIFRLAQIVYDTQYPGIPVVFSWPSKDRLLDYNHDRENAEDSEDAFLEVLHLLQKRAHVSTVYVVAHSMGNQIVVNSVDKSRRGNEKLFLSELVLAAPDVDWDHFHKLGHLLTDVAKGVTLYASSADAALIASNKWNGKAKPRAGVHPSNRPADTPLALKPLTSLQSGKICSPSTMTPIPARGR
jgi:esterase/lipase superfamily enzyme/Leucine-rich repeat (LRR) protein